MEDAVSMAVEGWHRVQRGTAGRDRVALGGWVVYASLCWVSSVGCGGVRFRAIAPNWFSRGGSCLEYTRRHIEYFCEMEESRKMCRVQGGDCGRYTQETTASEEVLGNRDLVALVLRYADLDPVSFVQMGLVNHAWREACQGDTDLILRAAAGRPYMTKRALMGLIGLTSGEANTLPRESKPRSRTNGGGWLWAYSPAVAPAALLAVGGIEGRRLRLSHRAMEQSSLWGRGYDCHPKHTPTPRKQAWSATEHRTRKHTDRVDHRHRYPWLTRIHAYGQSA
jgi:hypothetical protein